MGKKRIGFLSFWGVGRGLANITLGFVKMIHKEYDVFILKQGLNEITKDFNIEGINVIEHEDYIVDEDFFEKWIKDNKLDAVVFNEYKQWTNEDGNLVSTAKSLGCRTYGYLVAERFKKEQTYNYDRVLVPTVSMEKLMRTFKVRKFTYVPASIDLNEFPKKEKVVNEQFTFFHPGGMGGVHNRKNTDIVIEAFKKMDNKDTRLVITSQKPLNYVVPDNVTVIIKDLTRQELIDYYYKADATVLPSKWETVGIPIIESLAAGVPVITCEVPPMNEFVRIGMNGYLCNVSMTKYPDITIYAAEVDPAELAKSMSNILNKDAYELLSKNSRYIVEELYDLEKNKKYFLDFLEEDLR